MSNSQIQIFGKKLDIDDIYGIGTDIEEFRLLWIFNLTRIVPTITVKKDNQLTVVKGDGMTGEKAGEWLCLTNAEIEINGKKGLEVQLDNGLKGFTYE